MKSGVITSHIISLVFWVMVLMVGVLNIFLVHPIPGIAYLLLSFVYAPQVNAYLRVRFGFGIPIVVKIILAVVIIIFTLGVSDLGDMIDDL